MTNYLSLFKKNFLAEFIEAQISTSIMLGALVYQESVISTTSEERAKRDTDPHSPFLVEDIKIRRAAVGAATVSVLVSNILAQEEPITILGATSMALFGAIGSATELGRRVQKNKVNIEYTRREDQSKYLRDKENHKRNVEDLFARQKNVTLYPKQKRERLAYYNSLGKYMKSRKVVDYRVMTKTTPRGRMLNRSEAKFRHKVEDEIVKRVALVSVAITGVRALYTMRQSMV